MLDHREFIRLTAQVICQARRSRRAKRQVEARAAQVGINDQCSTVRLSNDGLRQVGCHKGLPLARYCARHQKSPQRLISAELIEPGTQGSKLFGAMHAQIRIEKNVDVWIEMPGRMRTTRAQVVESQIVPWKVGRNGQLRFCRDIRRAPSPCRCGRNRFLPYRGDICCSRLGNGPFLFGLL